MMDNRRSNKVLRILFVIFTVLYICFIFYNSTKPAVDSAEDSEGVTELINSFLRLFDPSLEISHNVVRTLAHFIEFMILGIFSFITFGLYANKLRIILPFSVLLPMIIAVCDETIQLGSEGRAFEVTDIITDVLGALLGIVLTLAVYGASRYINKTKQTEK